jgi:hypothetical protein
VTDLFSQAKISQVAAPLLLPRAPSKDYIVGGYKIPRGMIVMVIVWALHRDPKLWEEDESFELQRSKNIPTSEFQIFAIDIEYPICIDINIYA